MITRPDPENQLSLFPELPAPAPVARPAGHTPAERRRQRQLGLIAEGYHPLATLVHNLRLHPAAAPAGNRSAEGLRCGGCARRIQSRDTARAYPKCELYPSRSEASDIRSWWPACVHFTPETAK